MDIKGKRIAEKGQSDYSLASEFVKRVHLEDEEVVKYLKKQKYDKHGFNDSVKYVSETDLWDLESPMDDVEIKYESRDMLEHLWEKNQWADSSFDNNILWKCLKFCYLFPRNYEFHKDDLIQLWIAQDFFPFECNSGKDLEDSSQIYFNEFERCHIIRLSSFDSSTRQNRYMLNDSVVGLLEERADYDYFREGDVNSIITENTLHCSFPDSIDAFNLKELYQTKTLHTLLIFHEPGSHFNHIPRDLFLKLSWLRSLDLSDTSITELPSSVGKLKELRYLDLSRTPLTTLPSTICSLYQIQTLKLKGCLNLVGFPKGMRKLLNLRHLDVDLECLLVSMPPGLGDLRYLQSLTAFIVGTEQGYQITELKHMSNLAGTLRILRLENVSSFEEAKEAALDEKKYLAKLELHWNELEDGFQVLENLQPYRDLKELEIVGYGGAKFPSWIGDSIFCNLATITIHSCRICELLPPLGNLSSLYDLCISEMHEVRVIDHTFYGRNADMGNFDSSIQLFNLTHSAEFKTVKAFPRLEKLTLNGMSKLEKWSEIQEGDFCKLKKLSISCCMKLAALPELVYFKALQRLDISYCPLLKSFPNEGMPSSLEFLVIVDCPLLKEWCLNEVEQHCGKIADIQHVWIDYQLIPQGPFGISHQQPLSQVTAQAAQSQSSSQFLNDSMIASPTSSLDCRNDPMQMHDPGTAMVDSELSTQPPLHINKPEDDSCYWQVDGQEQGKASGFPQSYYKCRYQYCRAKKRVIKSFDGHVMEIIYEGQVVHKRRRNVKDAANSSEESLISGDQSDPNRINTEPASSISRRPRESTRTVLETTSKVEITDDGYRWRKYGEKDFFGDPYPRSYFWCGEKRCSATKQVQRSPDGSVFVTTYVGKHNHDVPSANPDTIQIRPTSHVPSANPDTTKIRPTSHVPSADPDITKIRRASLQRFLEKRKLRKHNHDVPSANPDTIQIRPTSHAPSANPDTTKIRGKSAAVSRET